MEERFQVDILLGDASWESSFSLPGEGTPPRVRIDVGLDWPTWSQSSYRSWGLGEATEDAPEVGIELLLRIQRLARQPDVQQILDTLPQETPPVGADPLERTTPT